MRYEVAVETYLAFYAGRQRGVLFPPPEDVVVEFEGRRFMWHATHRGPEGEECWPTVTTMIADPDDYEAERAAMERFLSALSFHYDTPMMVVNQAGAGWPAERDRPVAIATRAGLGNQLAEAPIELVTADDARLTRVMGYYRDGQGNGSPFYRFLAIYNALDVACEDHVGGLRQWVRDHAYLLASHHHWEGGGPPEDLWAYLQDESRHAVAHAVRDRNRPELDPNNPDERARFARDCRLLENLVKARVRERWGSHGVWGRRQP
jgi:Methylamine utilization protein MauJ